jgi:hypothetical protein
MGVGFDFGSFAIVNVGISLAQYTAASKIIINVICFCIKFLFL